MTISDVVKYIHAVLKVIWIEL